MKKLLLFLLLAHFSQSTHSQNDINGLWHSKKPGAELFIEISGAQGTITSVSNTKLTPNVVGGHLYENIKYEGNNTWSAQRNAWKYNGVNGVNSEKGRWEKAEMLKLTLSEDKNSLSASGHWTFKRVRKTIESTDETESVTAQKHSITEDFGGLNGKFTSGNTATKTIIVAQLTNNTKDKLARVLLTTDNGAETEEVLYPGNTLTKKYESKKLEIQVNYYENNAEKSESVIDKVKGKIRKMIINENGKLKTKIIGSIGVRG